MRLRFLLFGLMIYAMPSVSAHVIGGNGLSSGVLHPLSGLDHLLAMLSVGVLGTKYNEKKWFFPLAFVLSMILGGIIGALNIPLFFAEAGILFSVIILGIFLILRVDERLAYVGIAVFGLFHGHAHGAEMAVVLSPAAYFAGFIVSTTVIHVLGILTGETAKKYQLTTFINKLGYTMMMVGTVLFLNFLF